MRGGEELFGTEIWGVLHKDPIERPCIESIKGMAGKMTRREELIEIIKRLPKGLNPGHNGPGHYEIDLPNAETVKDIWLELWASIDGDTLRNQEKIAVLAEAAVAARELVEMEP